MSFCRTVSARNRMGLANAGKAARPVSQVSPGKQKQGLKLPIDVKVAKEQFSGSADSLSFFAEQAVAGSLGLSKTLGLSSSSSFPYRTRSLIRLIRLRHEQLMAHASTPSIA